MGVCIEQLPGGCCVTWGVFMAWRSIGSQLGRAVRLAAGALISASIVAFAAGPAEARHYRHVHPYARGAHYRHVAHHRAHAHWAAAAPASPAFSAIVVDANSGRTLYGVAEDGLRHPASITKVMTLYLLFEQLEKGAMTLQSRIAISEHAAAQEPSKLGIPPGGTISVEDAIKAVVTRSANDVAVAIAEAIGHDESAFAEMMTRKAQALGMTNTLYRNASGLPNDEQVTTARDLTILARSLEERFPHYFKYFSTREFDYAGEAIGNHNHLLGRVDGVDGIKTGYTRASGFNLLTSVHRDGRSLIAVVMGGRTIGARDRMMENLIEDHVAQASTVHTATAVADATASEEPAPRAEREEVPPAHPHAPAVAASVPARMPTARPVVQLVAEGDNVEEDDAPSLHVAAVNPLAKPRPAAPPRARVREPRPAAQPYAGTAPSTNAVERTPAQLGWVKGPDPAAESRVDLRNAFRRQGHARRREQRSRLRPRRRGRRGSKELDDPDRRDRRRRQGDRSSRQSARAEPFDPRCGQAGHRESAQGGGHVLPRALRRPRLRISGNRLPLPQALRIFMLRGPQLTKEPQAPVPVRFWEP